MSQRFILPTSGISSQTLNQNFFGEDFGYLVNYPGKSRYFTTKGAQETGVGTPPTDGDFTRVFVFNDSKGTSHIMFVKNNGLYVVEGNGYRHLYTFTGKAIDGLSYPYMFVHNDRLIVCNEGDHVMTWNGYGQFKKLGVVEIPPPPTVIVHEDPFVRNVEWYGLNIKTGFAIAPPYGIWSADSWPAGQPPENNLSNQVDALANKIPGFYAFRMVYVDDDGNRGVPSAPSAICFVKLSEQVNIDPASYPDNYDVINWATVEFESPSEDNHIYSVEAYRTLNLNKNLSNSPDVYYRDWIQKDITCQRYTSRRSDGSISADTEIDYDVRPPPKASYGCSFGPRIAFLDPDDGMTIWFTDVGKTGQCRLNNTYTARDYVESYTSIGDRFIIITRSTSEVLYYDNDGNIKLLEIYENMGSYNGRSFSTYGNVLFGFFAHGFYSFDGQKFEKIDVPLYIEKADKYSSIQRALILEGWYYYATRIGSQGSGNNSIVMLNLSSNRWFIVEETVKDLCSFDGVIYGVDNNVYEIYNGSTYPESVLHIESLLPEGSPAFSQRVVQEVSLLLDPKSDFSCSVELRGESVYDDASTATGDTYPSYRTVSRSSYKKGSYDSCGIWSSAPKFVSPDDVVVTLSEQLKPVSAHKHSVKLIFAVGGHQRIAALLFDITQDNLMVDKK